MNLNLKKIANRILCVSIFAFTVSSCQNDMDFVDPTEKNDVIQKLEAHGFTISSSSLTRSSSDIYQITEENIDEFLSNFEELKEQIENTNFDTTFTVTESTIRKRIKTRSENYIKQSFSANYEHPTGIHNLYIEVIKNGTDYTLDVADYSLTSIFLGSWDTEVLSKDKNNSNTFGITTKGTCTVAFEGLIGKTNVIRLRWTVSINGNTATFSVKRVS